MIDETPTLEAASYVLDRGVLDGASVSEGMLCLVRPDGSAVQIPVAREKVAVIARALLSRPVVVLLARDGMPMPDVEVPVETDAVRWEIAEFTEALIDAMAGGNVDLSTVTPERLPAATALKALAEHARERTEAIRVLDLIACVASDAVDGRRYPGTTPPRAAAFPGPGFLAALRVHELAMELRGARVSIDTAALREARETASLSEERNGLRRALHLIDTAVRSVNDIHRYVIGADEPTRDEVPDTEARDLVSMVRALVRLREEVGRWMSELDDVKDRMDEVVSGVLRAFNREGTVDFDALRVEAGELNALRSLVDLGRRHAGVMAFDPAKHCNRAEVVGWLRASAQSSVTYAIDRHAAKDHPAGNASEALAVVLMAAADELAERGETRPGAP